MLRLLSASLMLAGILFIWNAGDDRTTRAFVMALVIVATLGTWSATLLERPTPPPYAYSVLGVFGAGCLGVIGVGLAWWAMQG